MLRRLMRRAIVQGRRIGIEGGVPAEVRRARARADGERATPSCTSSATRSRCGSAARRRRSAGRSSRACGCSTTCIARAKDARGGGHRRRPGVPAARHLRLPVRAHARAGGRAGPGRRRAGLRGADGAAAPARALERGRAAGATTQRERDRRRSPRRPARRPTFTGYETLEQATAVGAHRDRERQACWPSSSSRRSTRPAAARWRTPAWSSASTATAARACVDVVRARRRPGARARAARGRAARGRARDRARRTPRAG